MFQDARSWPHSALSRPPFDLKQRRFFTLKFCLCMCACYKKLRLYRKPQCAWTVCPCELTLLSAQRIRNYIRGPRIRRACSIITRHFTYFAHFWKCTLSSKSEIPSSGVGPRLGGNMHLRMTETLNVSWAISSFHFLDVAYLCYKWYTVIWTRVIRRKFRMRYTHS
jgi:hypothetical protein